MSAGDAAALAELEVALAAEDAGLDAAGPHAAFDPALGAAPAIAPAFAPIAAPPPAAPIVAVPAAHVIVGLGAGVWAFAAGIGDAAAGEVTALQQRRKELRHERDVVNRDLRNAERKRQRLLERARGISDDDLLALVAARAVAKSNAKAKAKGKAKAKAKA
ncbi:MAG: hypothetical protein OSB41_09370 [Kiritimatiellae bacterium]|nr:hypothetical protein [Kiritimatiellia bacterium]